MEDEGNIFGKLLPQNLTAPLKQHLGRGPGNREGPQFSVLQILGGSRFPRLCSHPGMASTNGCKHHPYH